MMKKKARSIPWVLLIQFIHESLDKRQSLTGAHQQVAFAGALQVVTIRSALLKVKAFDLDSTAPFGVKILVSW